MMDFYNLSNKQFYIKREISQKDNDLSNYEDNYWHIIKDPDGNIRNRLEEREIYLDDIKQELDYINALKPGKVLDIGCGLGFFLSGISDKWDKYGIEISVYAANHAAQYGNISNINVEDYSTTGFKFDLIVIHHVIEHLDAPEIIIQNIYKLLRKNGRLIISTPDFDSPSARRYKEKYRLLHDKTHVSLFSNDSMHRFLRHYGFHIDSVEYPFFSTRHFNMNNLKKLFDTNTVSPPFCGNFMSFYCTRT
jgi:2-polyprenyl-3-methyl-5-hydroxy-6-metoxy-1,4-benzoquinol methylase